MITYAYLTGINVRDDKNLNFAKLICSGEKTIETRNSNSLKPYIGKRVRIIRTGIKNSKAMIIGECTIGEPIIYKNKNDFDNDCDKHFVGKESKFYIKDSVKFGYPIINPCLYKIPYLAQGLGIIARLNQPAPEKQLINII